MKRVNKKKSRSRKKKTTKPKTGLEIIGRVDNPVFVSVDVETTGLGIFTTDELIEIGASAGKDRTFRRHFIPSVPIASSASQVHGMVLRENATGEMRLCVKETGEVMPTVPLEVGLRDFIQFLDSCGEGRPVVLIAHNASFDGRFIRGALESSRLFDAVSFEKIYLGCSLVASRRLDPHIKGPGKHKQEAVYRRIFNKGFSGAHSGLGDATALYDIITHWVETRGSETLQQHLNMRFLRRNIP